MFGSSSMIAMLILLSFLISAVADTYVWQHSSNWNQTRLPCVAETAFLNHPPTPKDTRWNKFEITIDVNTTLKRLLLAPGSQVRLQKGTQLKLSEKTTCKDNGLPSVTDASVNNFIGVQPHPWNCANNWKRQSDSRSTGRVPCSSDTVLFPSGKSISWVSLQSDVKVAQLIWEGKPVNVLSDIPNSDAYFVKVSTFSNLKIDPQCLSSQLSACPCYPSNCSAYPTAPPPLTTKSSATGTKLITTTTCNPANQNCLPTVVICNEGDKSGCQASIKDSNSTKWPLIVGILVGVVVILVFVVIGLLVWRHRERSNARNVTGYDHQSDPTMEQSFVNPVFQHLEKQMDNATYQSPDDISASNSGDPTAIYEKVDEDGLPC